MEENNEDQTGTIHPGEMEDCPQCGKLFRKGASLRMHIVRTHGKGWDTSANFKNSWRARRARRLANLNRKGGKPWTDAQRAKFARTWRAKKKAKRIQIVYPDPGQQDQPTRELAQINVPTLKHCPNCGEHLEGWRYQP